MRYRGKAIETSGWTRENLAWAAGLFEGEGCLTFNKSVSAWQLCIVMTDRDVLEKFQRIIGGGTIIDRPAGRDGQKRSWLWRLAARDKVYAVVIALWPWMCQRRQERMAEYFQSWVPLSISRAVACTPTGARFW